MMFLGLQLNLFSSAKGAAVPPDVRKGSAFPMLSSGEFSEAVPRECLGGTASNKLLAFPESHRLSAHRAAKPQALTSATSGSLPALRERLPCRRSERLRGR